MAAIQMIVNPSSLSYNVLPLCKIHALWPNMISVLIWCNEAQRCYGLFEGDFFKVFILKITSASFEHMNLSQGLK